MDGKKIILVLFFILFTVTTTELVYYFIQSVKPQQGEISCSNNNNNFALNKGDFNTLPYLINMVTARNNESFAGGTVTGKYIAYIADVQKNGDYLKIDIIKDIKGTKITPLTFFLANITFYDINRGKITYSDFKPLEKISIEMTYDYLNNNMSVVISKI